METVFYKLKEDGFFPKEYSLIKALQFVSYKNYPVERVLLCKNEDLNFALNFFLEMNSLFEEDSENKKWKRMLNANYKSLIQLAKRMERKKGKPSYQKVLDLIKKEFPFVSEMNRDEIVHFMYATNYYVSTILTENKFNSTLKDAAILFLEKEETKNKDESEVWEEFLDFEVEKSISKEKPICSHREIVLVNEVGPRIPSGGHEVLFKIKCHECSEVLFLTSEYKRNIINISKH